MTGAFSDNRPLTSGERAVKNAMLANVGKDFHYREECVGEYLVDGSGVRADIMLRPKKHLIERGFLDEWFAVEIKDIDVASAKTKEIYALFWQAITYGQSAFSIDGHVVRPSCVVLCVPNKAPNYHDEVEMAQRRRWDILAELGVYANVGYFDFPSPSGWRIWFGQARYFDSETGQTKIPRGMGRRCGNSGKKRPKPNSLFEGFHGAGHGP